MPALIPLSILVPFLAAGHSWWLPANYSRHGTEVDSLFLWIVAATVLAFVVVQGTLLWLILRYRAGKRPEPAMPINGSTRAELTWTIIPALLLTTLALASRKVWTDFRQGPELTDPARTRILVIGEQFKWNIIYPGPDGQFGRYLQFPKPGDALWPIGPRGKRPRIGGVEGPAKLPIDKAYAAINNFIQRDEYRLGKDYSDPVGMDDDYEMALARTLYVPVNRPVDIELTSKDVIHDFYVPTLRVQLYAVPGMTGHVAFTVTTTTRELERAAMKSYAIDDLPTLLKQPENRQLAIDIDAGDAGVARDADGLMLTDAAGQPIIHDGETIFGSVEKLKSAGFKSIKAHPPQSLELICNQICGVGHASMRAEMVVLSQEEFDRRFPAAPHAPKFGGNR